MKTRTYLPTLAAVAAVLAFSTPSFSAEHSEPKGGEVMETEVMETEVMEEDSLQMRVQQAVTDTLGGNASMVTVDVTDDGVVTLTGEAEETVQVKLIAAATQVDGVTEVVDLLDID